jgi:hypothetical protein
MYKKSNNAGWANMKLMTAIKESHYQWCLKNGRDISWYQDLKNKKNGSNKKN